MTIDSSKNAVSVIGLGTMGHGIVQTFALAGYQVKAFDENSQAVLQLHQRIAANVATMQDLGVIDQVNIDALLSRIQCCTTESEVLIDSQFITEAIAEDLQMKQEFFARCEELVAPDTLLASNTSSFPMTEIASQLEYPERAINTHWFNPPHVIPVVEVIPGQQTSEQTIEQAMSLLQSIGKQPVRIHQELPGFVMNRLQVALFREMLDLVGRGVISAEDLDVAVRGSLGLRWAAVGPMRVGDFGGWDILAKVYQVLAPEIRSDSELPQVLDEMVDCGNLGLKTGQGFFEFPETSQDEIIRDKDNKFVAWAQLLKEAYKE